MNQISTPIQSFAEAFEASIKDVDFKTGSLIKARVMKVTPECVTVDAGFKSESRIPAEEFKDRGGQIEVVEGEEVDVLLESIENGSGETKLSREKAKRMETWNELEKYYENQESIYGYITERVRGGFTVEVGKVKAFLPGSLLDIKPVKDPSVFEGKELELKVIKVDKKNNNIVVSRKAVIQAESSAERAILLGNLKEGDEVIGVIKNITDYGAFVDLGGIDGLLHITDMSWKRVRHPNEIVKVGDEIKVRVLRFDRDKNRVSLGLKQLADDPWQDITRRYPIKSRLFGKVTNITDYGFFVEIEPGIEGLVHMSEIDWTNKNVNPAKIITPGQEIEVMLLEVDPARRRISLGMKQCQPNPWEEFAANHNKDEKVVGKVKSITDFGLFLGLEGGIDGLVHLSDLSWNEPGEQTIRNYKKGQEVEAVILSIDPERERISLGVRQLQGDVYLDYFAKNPKGTVIKGKVTEVTPKYAEVSLEEGIVGRIRAADVSRATVKDVTQFLVVGDEIEAKILGFDKKGRYINLSIKELQPELGVENSPVNTQLGDLLREQIEEKKQSELDADPESEKE